MIREDQPTLLSSSHVKAIFSSIEDRSMAKGGGQPSTAEHENRRKSFLEKHGFSTTEPVILSVRYADDKDYRTTKRVSTKDIGRAVDSDCLYTTDVAVPILLPVADCIATVVYDPKCNLLGVLHLGRHASIAHAIESFAAEVKQSLDSNPIDWRVWMSPNLQKESNLLDYFVPESPDEWEPYIEKRGSQVTVDIPAHNKSRFGLLGVLTEHIEMSPINTYQDKRYYSHRAAVELNQPERDGRMAVVAQLIK